jgi:predicted MPP superfamily phosphohydrolase
LVLAVQLLGTAVLVWGAMIEPTRLTMTRLRLTTDRLMPGTPPIRILHITDLHVERLTQRESDILRFMEQAQPDLIVVTGDFVNLSYNQDRETYRQVRQFLSQLVAPYGVYATLGTPPVDLREWVAPLFDGLPITLMRESWKKIDLGRGRQVVLMGMDCTHDIPTDAGRLKRLMLTAPKDAPQVLLYHSPELMPQATGHEIDLYVCGHTHGGQVRLPIVGPLLTSSQLGRQYVMGLYRNGRTCLYVSRGVGLEGLSAPRVRFMAPPEITLVTLRPA